MLVRCTSTSGAVSPARASRSTTEVCDQPPGLITTASPASAASKTQPSSSPSESVCRTTTSRPSSVAAASISPTSSAYVVVPYFSGSRLPSRPRLAPLSTWIVTSSPRRRSSSPRLVVLCPCVTSQARSRVLLTHGGPRRVQPGLVGIGQDRRVAQPVEDDEPQRRPAGLLVHPHHRLQPPPVAAVARRQAHRRDQLAMPVGVGPAEHPGRG